MDFSAPVMLLLFNVVLIGCIRCPYYFDAAGDSIAVLLYFECIPSCVMCVALVRGTK